MKKPIPTLKTDRQAETFVATANLADYDLSGGHMMHFERRPKNKIINLHLPEPLQDAARNQAKKTGVPYQRFIRMALEQAITTPRA